MNSKIQEFLLKRNKLEAFQSEIINLLMRKCTINEIVDYLKDYEDFQVTARQISHFIISRKLRKKAAEIIKKRAEL